jgi:membrane associated rhomboid family serine protease
LSSGLGRTQAREISQRAQPPPPPSDPSQFEEEYRRPPNEKLARNIVGAFILINAGVFIYGNSLVRDQNTKGGRKTFEALEKFRQEWTLSFKNISEGRYYTMIASEFAHLELWHFAANMLAIWSFSGSAIRIYGIPGFIGLYFASAVAASAGQLLAWKWTGRENQQALGASGVASGIVTAYSLAAPMGRMALLFIPMSMGTGIVLWIVFSVGGLNGLWAPSLGHGAHLGGSALGALWWLVALRRSPLGPQQYIRWFQHNVTRRRL